MSWNGSISVTSEFDFEASTHEAIKATYPETVIEGCFFHYRQSIRKNISKSGCLELYNHEASFRKYVSFIIFLCFVPKKEVIEVYEKTAKVIIKEYEGEYN